MKCLGTIIFVIFASCNVHAEEVKPKKAIAVLGLSNSVIGSEKYKIYKVL
jgi:hypothetical protein